MTARSYEYTLRCFHRVQSAPTIEAVHKLLMNCLKSLDGAFGMPPNVETPPAPAEDCGGALDGRVFLTKLLGRGIRLATAKYTYRQNPSYTQSIKVAGLDDSFICSFDARKVDFRDVAMRAFPRIVEAFHAYRGDVHCEEFFMQGSDQWQRENERRGLGGIDVDGRDSVMYLHAANYWDGELCERAFGLRPVEVVARLKGKVLRTEVLGNGALATKGGPPALPGWQ
jgi:hypothetical protein